MMKSMLAGSMSLLISRRRKASRPGGLGGQVFKHDRSCQGEVRIMSLPDATDETSPRLASAT